MNRVQQNCSKVMRSITRDIIGAPDLYYDVSWTEKGELELYAWKPPMSKQDGWYVVWFNPRPESFINYCKEIRESHI